MSMNSKAGQTQISPTLFAMQGVRIRILRGRYMEQTAPRDLPGRDRRLRQCWHPPQSCLDIWYDVRDIQPVQEME